MEKKAVSGIMLTFLLIINMLTLTPNIQPVKAEPGTIYIRADGSVDPSTAPILRNGDVYTLTGNINDSIVVQRDGIVVDGAGYNLTGPGMWSGKGINLAGRSNVTIKNMKVEAFKYGIDLWGSTNNSITGNNIAGNDYGVYLSSSNNSIVGNTFTNDGLFVGGIYGNTVEGNVVNGKPLVYLEGVSNFTVDNAGQVMLINCDNIRVENLNLSYTPVGVGLLGTSNSKIAGNKIANKRSGNRIGIYLSGSSNNSISGNNIRRSMIGIYLYESSKNSIDGNNIANSYPQGVYLYESSNNIIAGNSITKNLCGIELEAESSNNIIVENNIASNDDGIFSYSPNNKFYHNNFIDNERQVYTRYRVNTWDDGYPSGGNYWSDYTGVDLFNGPYQNWTGSDGIGDTPYIIDADNIDRYPIVLQHQRLYIYPNRGGNTGKVTVRIKGTGFSEGAVPKLVKEGYPDIIGSNTTISPSVIVTVFNLTGVEPETIWDVVVTLPNGTELLMEDAFTVLRGGEPVIYVDIIGRDQIRVGRTETYIVRVFNEGTIDSGEALIDIKLGEALKMMCIETMHGIVIWNRTAIEETIARGKEAHPDLWVGEPEGIVDEFLNKTLLWIPNIGSGDSITFKVTLYAKMPIETREEFIIKLILVAFAPELLGINFIKHLLSQMTYAALSPDETKDMWWAFKNAMIKTCEDLHTPLAWIKEGLSKFVKLLREDPRTATKVRPYVQTFAELGLEALAGLQVCLEFCDKIEKASEDFKAPTTEAQKPVNLVMSWDPNDKVGPTGYGQSAFITPDIELEYIIYFENLENATAPAENIVITDTLDTDLNWSTLAVGNTSHPRVINYAFNQTTGTITWTFTNINLPPDKVPPEGEGWVSFKIKPKPGLSSGTEIRNNATIVFDNNPPMNTGEVLNTIDSQPPTSRVSSLPTDSSINFTVSWTGSDETSGVKGFTIWFSEDGDPYMFWLRTTEASATFTGEPGHAYAFYSTAHDNVGNVEDTPATPDATTTIVVVDATKPVANAGSNQTVDEDTLITLDGSASSDNVGIAAYKWTFTDVTNKTLAGEKPTYTFNTPGVYTITLNVTDVAGNWATDTITITVVDVTKPIANAGQDRTVNVAATVNFDASGSTDNVGIISYEWDFGDGTIGTGKTTTHTYRNSGTYTATLTVKDATGNTATHSITITVSSPEAFPTWIIGAAVAAITGVFIILMLMWKRKKV